MSLEEDGCQTRTEAAPCILAHLNNTILSLMNQLGVRNVTRQMCSFDASLDDALTLVLTRRCSVF